MTWELIVFAASVCWKIISEFKFNRAPEIWGAKGGNAMMKSTLNDALRRAWENYTENDGVFTKINPAICRDGKGVYFGSALNGDQVVFDLSEIVFGYSPDEYERAEDFAADLEPVVDMVNDDIR